MKKRAIALFNVVLYGYGDIGLEACTVRHLARINAQAITLFHDNI
ncbi:hypothetical protein ACF3DV_00590 [Chlorogloeopsis fritschii PCC 9212]|nr:hypothetical protein [Chlorogloeopsis fritschii]